MRKLTRHHYWPMITQRHLQGCMVFYRVAIMSDGKALPWMEAQIFLHKN